MPLSPAAPHPERSSSHAEDELFRDDLWRGVASLATVLGALGVVAYAVERSWAQVVVTLFLSVSFGVLRECCMGRGCRAPLACTSGLAC